MLPRRGIALVAVVVLPAVGCASRVSPIGPGYRFQPDEREQRIWQTAEQDSRILRSKGILFEDEALQTYTNSVLARLLGSRPEVYSPLTGRIYIINSPTVNAFSFANGDTFVYAGILGRIRNEAQLAMLLGHEITHATHRHAYQETGDAYAKTAAMQYVSLISVAGGYFQNVASGLSQLVTVAAISGYSRDKERESDRIGLTLMAQAGYDPREGAKFFQAMLDAADRKDLRYNVLYATHPKMKERVEVCTALVRELPTDLLVRATDTGTDRYLAVAAGVIHDDIERQIARGKYSLAESGARFLVENKPDDAIGYAYLGEVCRIRNGSGDTRQARDAYTKAIELNAGQPLALRGLGFLCLKEGAKEEAVKYLRAYISAARNAPDLGYVQQTIENLDKK